MKKVVMLLLVIGLFAVPVISVKAAPVPFEDGTLIIDNGYMGFGETANWSIMTSGSAGTFSMSTPSISLDLTDAPLNYQVQISGNDISFTFGIIKDYSLYSLNLAGSLVDPNVDPNTYRVFGSLEVAPVPLPASLLLLASGLVGVGGLKRKLRKV
jgi:hypothetical protein